MNHSDWYRIYTAALLELNPAKLPSRIHEAETAIFLRTQNLGEDSDSSRERESIADALASLKSLQRNPPRHPDHGQAVYFLFDRT
jgi:hypothetical protein